MTIQEMLKAIKSGKLESVYLLFGEERYYARQAERAIVDAVLPPEDRDIGLRVFEQDPSVPELVQAIESMPFFGGKNVIIIRDTKLFRTSKNEDGQESADKADARLINCLQMLPDYTHLIFIAGDKVDKRRKLFKTIEKAGAVIELSPIKARDARGWIQSRLKDEGSSIAADALEYLLTGISFMPQITLGFLDSEIQKAILHAGDRKHIRLSDVEATIAGVPEISVFAMIDAMSQKNSTVALKILDEQLAIGESPMRLLMLIARQARALLQCKELSNSGKSAQDLAKQLGLHPFIAEKMTVQARRFSEIKLKQILLLISDADRAIKSGKAGNVSLENIVITMCRE